MCLKLQCLQAHKPEVGQARLGLRFLVDFGACFVEVDYHRLLNRVVICSSNCQLQRGKDEVLRRSVDSQHPPALCSQTQRSTHDVLVR